MLVDDHDLFRSGLRMLLEEEGFEVSDAGSGAEALRRIRVRRPDAILMDINMPGMSGVETTRQVQALAPGLPVLMLTVAMDDQLVVDAVRAGACGYLLKDADLDDIVAALKGAAAGQSVIASRVAGGVLSRLRNGRQPADDEHEAGAEKDLSDREREVLRLLATGAENAEIARRLYVSVGTVKNHVSAILAKLGVENRVQAAVYGMRCGLID